MRSLFIFSGASLDKNQENLSSDDETSLCVHQTSPLYAFCKINGLQNLYFICTLSTLFFSLTLAYYILITLPPVSLIQTTEGLESIAAFFIGQEPAELVSDLTCKATNHC